MFFVGLLVGGVGGLVIGLLYEARSTPAPICGQHWNVRGLGIVRIVGATLDGNSEKTLFVKYEHKSWTSKATLREFLANATLIEEPKEGAKLPAAEAPATP